MNVSDEPVTPFFKSSYSGSDPNHECVEVAHTAAGGRAVRDSKDPARGTAYFGAEAWQAFVTALGNGQEAG
ncbi:DUF397 domain-containing protein [Streptomyces sp. WMMB303]|uniref:DUF397 domain-containing protein n=1 Tax=Streptomyces sp. WMMB303 TaxID=3034154 RepID=UPI0023EDD032|nr:DUF397 domain-containing protein [Streptomyces sp. WMMB303]MDF4250548.1 DUF397 domain-containing protein [Streptomyces sp. WMMB303]